MSPVQSISIQTMKSLLPLKLNSVIKATTCSLVAMGISLSCLQPGQQLLLPAMADSEVVLDGEVLSIFRQGRQTESDGDFEAAQRFYEQVVQAAPDYVYGWSNLGNVLTAEGNLDQALLCYRKAISLKPNRNDLSIIVLNKASIELSTGDTEAAMRDLEAVEKLSGPTPTLLTNKAVALSNLGRWEESLKTFEEVISTADRNALPWWLRFSMALLESGRGTESVAFLQRTLNRFPDEVECKAYAAALYTSLGSGLEAGRYWRQLSDSDRATYTPQFVQDKLKWGPKAVKSFNAFLSSKYAIVPATSS